MDGSPHLVRGVVIFTVASDLVQSARFYLEPVTDGEPAARFLAWLAAADDAATVAGVPRVGVFAVPAFSTREALNYLSGRLTSDPDQRKGAIDLAGELGGEPAALAQAAAVILSSGIRCSEYREYLAQRRAQIAAGAGPLPVAAVTWALSAWYAGQLAPGALPASTSRTRAPARWLTRKEPGSRCRPCSRPDCTLDQRRLRQQRELPPHAHRQGL
jgi:hypothetical protein